MLVAGAVLLMMVFFTVAYHHLDTLNSYLPSEYVSVDYLTVD